jgi:hypothetical protein
MTRSFDTIPKDVDQPAEVGQPAAPLMSVCPFCGAISEKKNDGACPRCKMDNTALTRQATRARVGPWYVMQARNPSAPGMKCGTLLALIRKGQVTPRSVIRGPTTFQLWRFAARVKGISREFGLCYSCGGEVQRTSTFCPRCSRSQELPPNPDALLENEVQSARTIYRETQSSSRPATPVSNSRGGSDSSASDRSHSRSSGEPDASRSPRQSSQIPSAAETMAELADLPSPHNAPAELQSRPRQRPQEGVLSARELAAVFSLQYDPTMDVSGSRRRRQPNRLARRLLGFAASLIIVGAIAATLYWTPSLRQRIVAWVQDSSPSASTPTDVPPAPPPQPKTLQTQAPMWMMPPPVDSPPITTPAPAEAPKKQPVVPSTPPVQHAAPAPIPPPAVASAAHIPPDHSDAAAPPAAAAAAEQLRQAADGDLDSLAMELRSNGLDAEHRQDYSSAEYYYQQVEKLPHDHWPGDIEQLLQGARERLAAAH